MSSSTQQKRILLTGAAGGIGSAFYHYARDRYWFRLADRRMSETGADREEEHEAIALDIADPQACQEACKHIDTVIHLAADANPASDFYASLLMNNIAGTYNVFRAARDQGCRRVIFASSAHVLAGYPRDVQVHQGMPVRPITMYGVSKCFGEALASYFADAEGLSCIAVRIGAYDAGGAATRLRERPNASNLSAYVSERDLNQLLACCVEATEVTFAIVHGSSNNRFKRLDITSTRSLLGYAPVDDSFEIFSPALHEWLED